MKLTKKAICSSLAAVTAVSGLMMSSQVSAVELSASAAVASSYLWRGQDMGSGSPAVSGDLIASAGGAYAGIWGTSGDSAVGTEYDLFAGYGTTLGAFTFDISVLNYNYPTGPEEIDAGDLTEVILSVGVGPMTLAYYDNVAGASGYEYYSLGFDIDRFSLLVGMHDNPGGDDPVHLDLSYAYNENLSFTLSQFISDEPPGDDLKFVVSYSLPILD
ncbi:MAG: TorF family putative porin [Porticoccaceae bacterium]